MHRGFPLPPIFKHRLKSKGEVCLVPENPLKAGGKAMQERGADMKAARIVRVGQSASAVLILWGLSKGVLWQGGAGQVFFVHRGWSCMFLTVAT